MGFKQKFYHANQSSGIYYLCFLINKNKNTKHCIYIVYVVQTRKMDIIKMCLYGIKKLMDFKVKLKKFIITVVIHILCIYIFITLEAVSIYSTEQKRAITQ